MTLKCNKCGGYIPDLFFGGKYVDRSDCKNHTKSNLDFPKVKIQTSFK